jgi:hypothetical protein
MNILSCSEIYLLSRSEYWHLSCYQKLLETSISVLYIPNSLHYPLKCKRIYASYTIIFQVLETINIYITDKKKVTAQDTTLTRNKIKHIMVKIDNFHSQMSTMHFKDILTFNFLAWDLTWRSSLMESMKP